MAAKSSDRPDPDRQAKQFAEFAEQTQRIFRAFMERQTEAEVPPGFDPLAVSKAFWDGNAKLMRDPKALMEANGHIGKACRDCSRPAAGG